MARNIRFNSAICDSRYAICESMIVLVPPAQSLVVSLVAFVPPAQSLAATGTLCLTFLTLCTVFFTLVACLFLPVVLCFTVFFFDNKRKSLIRTKKNNDGIKKVAAQNKKVTDQNKKVADQNKKE